MTVDYGAAALRVEVTDTGRGLTDSAAEAAYAAFFASAGSPVFAPGAFASDLGGVPPGTVGHGLRGMRERAAAAGGTIDIGPRPAGGFRVAARLPLDGQPAAAADSPPATPTEKTSPTQKAGR